MILAGVMLKLGGFGLIRVLWAFGSLVSPLQEFIIRQALLGGLLARGLCIIQRDVKALVAYSSVAHMSLCFAGIISCTGIGWCGGIRMMFAHGITSPLLFAIAALSYGWAQSRRILLTKGLLMV